MRALVLGGAGFAGVATCKELMRRGVETIAAGRTDQPYGTFTSFEQVDRADHDALERLLARREPDVVVDLAHPTLPEADWLAGTFRGRHLLFTCVDQRPIPAKGRRVVLRSGPVIGGGDRSGRLSACIAAIEEGRPLAVSGEDAGLVWVKDLGFALALAADLGRPVEGRAFDIAFPRLSLADLLGMLAAMLGRQLQTGGEENPFGPPARLDAGAADTELGWRASPPEECLAEVLAHHRASRRG